MSATESSRSSPARCRWARKARALGVEVVGHDPWASAPEGVELIALHELLSSADAVSLHTPAEHLR
jgi:phosphoglycerate dehydrogenase-like enzyme